MLSLKFTYDLNRLLAMVYSRHTAEKRAFCANSAQDGVFNRILGARKLSAEKKKRRGARARKNCRRYACLRVLALKICICPRCQQKLKAPFVDERARRLRRHCWPFTAAPTLQQVAAERRALRSRHNPHLRGKERKIGEARSLF